MNLKYLKFKFTSGMSIKIVHTNELKPFEKARWVYTSFLSMEYYSYSLFNYFFYSAAALQSPNCQQNFEN